MHRQSAWARGGGGALHKPLLHRKMHTCNSWQPRVSRPKTAGQSQPLHRRYRSAPDARTPPTPGPSKRLPLSLHKHAQTAPPTPQNTSPARSQQHKTQVRAHADGLSQSRARREAVGGTRGQKPISAMAGELAISNCGQCPAARGAAWLTQTNADAAEQLPLRDPAWAPSSADLSFPRLEDAGFGPPRGFPGEQRAARGLWASAGTCLIVSTCGSGGAAATGAPWYGRAFGASAHQTGRALVFPVQNQMSQNRILLRTPLATHM